MIIAITCFFTNNGMPTSLLTCNGVGRFPAFSGQRQGRNNASLTSVRDIGPIPQGTYYIIGRQSGGRLSSIREAALKYAYSTDRRHWFSLYRRDGKIDDYTLLMACDEVISGYIPLVHVGLVKVVLHSAILPILTIFVIDCLKPA